MLDQDGNITFLQEIMDTIDAFLEDYQSRQGPLRNDLERGLVISYLLGIMRCEIETLWDELGKAPTFGSLHPRVVFEDCAGSRDTEIVARRTGLLRAQLRSRGWT